MPVLGISAVDALCEPLGIAWMALAVVALVLWRGRNRIAALSLTLIVAGQLVVGGTPLSAWLLARLESRYAGLPPVPFRGVDAIVMLGGGYSASMLEPTEFDASGQFDRLLTAMLLGEQGASTNLVLGGGSSGPDGSGHLDSEAPAAWLRRRLPASTRVHILPFSRNTRDEGVWTAELAKKEHWHRIALVTSASHLRRAVAVFERVDFEVTPVGCDFSGMNRMRARHRWTIVPNADDFRLAGRWTHEILGWLSYRCRGWV